MESVDLTNVPVVDNHCHGVTTDQALGDVETWRRAFTIMSVITVTPASKPLR
jgi:hypothetical protein